jgi:hypothetical protein
VTLQLRHSRDGSISPDVPGEDDVPLSCHWAADSYAEFLCAVCQRSA